MKSKFEVGQAVIERSTGRVYFVAMVFCNGMINIEDDNYRYLDMRSPDEFDIYDPRKDV